LDDCKAAALNHIPLETPRGMLLLQQAVPRYERAFIDWGIQPDGTRLIQHVPHTTPNRDPTTDSDTIRLVMVGYYAVTSSALETENVIEILISKFQSGSRVVLNCWHEWARGYFTQLTGTIARWPGITAGSGSGTPTGAETAQSAPVPPADEPAQADSKQA